jgi:hypothetical protein
MRSGLRRGQVLWQKTGSVLRQVKCIASTGKSIGRYSGQVKVLDEAMLKSIKRCKEKALESKRRP